MTDQYFLKILEKVKEERNLDFSGYRENLLSRRVMMRVRLTKRDTFEEYLAYLKFHHDEMDLLMDQLTINVTEFFRDSNVFDAIEKKVIPEIVTNKKRMTHDAGPFDSLALAQGGRMTLRVWSCACSSGEEPYSVLMVIAEHLKSRIAEYKLTIYATDIDPGSLSRAREGIYEAAQFKNLSPERKLLLNKYFYDMGNGRYWVREEWSPHVEFIYHDVISDIPLESMDMILCRNMLIYFDKGLQDQVIERFHTALNDGGFLVLGNVESISGRLREKFEEYDRSARIYRKK